MSLLVQASLDFLLQSLPSLLSFHIMFERCHKVLLRLVLGVDKLIFLVIERREIGVEVPSAELLGDVIVKLLIVHESLAEALLYRFGKDLLSLLLLLLILLSFHFGSVKVSDECLLLLWLLRLSLSLNKLLDSKSQRSDNRSWSVLYYILYRGLPRKCIFVLWFINIILPWH